MNSCCGCEEVTSGDMKRKVTLRFKREGLLYEIATMGFVEGDLQSEEEKAHDAHQTQDIVEDGNVDRVTRMLDLAYTTCKERLYPYSKEDETGDIVMDDDFMETDTYDIVLTVPETFTKMHAEHLRNLIHEYLIGAAIGDWLSVTKPKAAENWLAKAEASIEEAKETMFVAGKTMERPMSVF